MIQIPVLRIAVIVSLSNNGGRRKDHADTCSLQLLDDRLVETAELVKIRAGSGTTLVPYIVDTDIDHDDVRRFCEHILLHPQIKIVDLISANTCTN